MADVESLKRRVGEWAASQVDDGMIVGLGTGSTAARAIEALGAADLDVRGVATSLAAADRATAAGIELLPLDAADRIDLAIDGADQVAERTLLKGGGGAHTIERIVAMRAGRFVVVVDEGKEVSTIDRAVPIEVLAVARGSVEAAIQGLDGRAVVRQADRLDGPAFTERGNVLLDADFGAIDDPAGLAGALWAIPGVLDHGLFVDVADTIAVGTPEGVQVRSY